MIRKKGNKNFILRTLTLTALLAGFAGMHAGASMEDRFVRIEWMQQAQNETGESGRIAGSRLIELMGDFAPEDELEFGSETEFEGETEFESETEVESETWTEAETETETESGTEPETESETGTETESKSERETETEIQETKMPETIPEPEPETEAVSEAETESEIETEGIPETAFTLPEDLERALAELTGMEPETEGEMESETEESDERTLIAKAMLEEIQLGSDFRIPMAMPGELGGIPEYKYYHCSQLPFERRDTGDWSGNRTIGELETTVKNAVWGYEGTWSVYVKNLNTDESFLINDTPMKSASVMKLFIMGTVYTSITDGTLERTDTIVSLLNKMITFSDNEASNELLSILGNGSYADGIAKVNTFIQEHGYSEMTVEYNGFSNPATNTGNGTNQVSAADVGQLLEDIYRRTWLTREQSNEVEAMMLAQDTRYKIPAGLPDGVLCANKTGEMDGTENDAAIVYSDGADYILVILSSDWGSSDLAVSRIGNLSALVYDFFNN